MHRDGHCDSERWGAPGPEEGEGHLTIRTVEYRGKTKSEYFASGTPDLSFLNERGKHLDEVIRNITQDHSASSISEKSHDRLWDVAEPGERIPYQQQLLCRFAPLLHEDSEAAP
jgi:hypothetical protein